MRLLVHAILCLVLFSAAMEGVFFLAADGISRTFGSGFCFGAALAMALITFVTDRDQVTVPACLIAVAFLSMTAAAWGAEIAAVGQSRDIIAGPLVGVGLLFPLALWATNQDRDKRGRPRPKLAWRARDVA